LARTIIRLFVFWAALAVAASAQNFNPVVVFNGTNGEDIFSSLIQASDGNFYGTTVYGGANGYGTFFSLSQTGVHTILYNFCAHTNCSDGAYPEWLTQGADGNFYGETFGGGANGGGTVFKLTSNGVLTTLHAFCSQPSCTDGDQPQSALVQAKDGNFYGTTITGGKNGVGTIFRITPNGVLNTLYNFCSKANCADGSQPYVGLLLAKDGSFYGTTAFGGGSNSCALGCGTVFRFTPPNRVTTVYSFCAQANCVDGSIPQGLLVQASDGSLYGTTDGGGTIDAGTVYRIGPRGKFNTVHSFCTGTCADGLVPYAGLIQASDGNLYGTANAGGPNGFGTVYRITPTGKFTTLFGFDGGTDGAFPAAGVIQGSDGNLYGGTEEGGDDSCFAPSGCGVVFRLSLAADASGTASPDMNRPAENNQVGREMPLPAAHPATPWKITDRH
jgi:uncharacterized repeat protein (TIGR03803 family)